MSTLSTAPTLLQRLEAACAGQPLHDPATDAWVQERRRAYEAEQQRDLSGLSREELRQSRDRILGRHGEIVVELDCGIAIEVDRHDGITDAAVDSVETFVETWGLPCTHARAWAIVEEIQQRTGADPHRDDLDRALERADEIQRESDREDHYLRHL